MYIMKSFHKNHALKSVIFAKTLHGNTTFKVGEGHRRRR